MRIIVVLCTFAGYARSLFERGPPSCLFSCHSHRRTIQSFPLMISFYSKNSTFPHAQKCLLGFLFLLVLSQASRNQSLQFLVLKLLLSLDEIRLVPHRGLGNQQRPTGQQGDSEMEAGDKGVRWSVPAQLLLVTGRAK